MSKVKTAKLEIPVSPEEKALICRAAARAGSQTSPWARSILLFEAAMAETEVELAGSVSV